MKNNIIQFTKEKESKVRAMCLLLEKIKGKSAIDLLREYDIELSPPINVSLLLDKMGVSVIAKDFSVIEREVEWEDKPILGAAISKGDSLAIFYNKTDTYNRKLFTIAHELGHCCKHADNLKIEHIELRTDNNDLDAHEIEANIFAGELLVPEVVLKPIYDSFILPSLKNLSSIFCVSTNVMAARLDYLKLAYLKDAVIDEE